MVIATITPARAAAPARPAAPGSVGPLAALRGDVFERSPAMPAYRPLPAGALAAAEARSTGRTQAQRPITNRAGASHEPINLVVTGSRSEIVAALQASGWTVADEIGVFSGLKSVATVLDAITPLHRLKDYDYEASPVSDMYLGGERHVLAFSKNNDHDLARDHLRLFATPRKDAAGRPIWEVAATRDIGMRVDLKARHGEHVIDTHVDPERDQVMADLLGTGQVRSWHVAAGVMTPADALHTRQQYRTDGKVFQVELRPRPELDPALGLRPDPEDRLIERLPAVLEGPMRRLDRKLTGIVRSWT